MQKRYFLKLILLIIFVFTSFSSLNFLRKHSPLDASIYSLNTVGMNRNHHTPPLFFLKKNGVFFIHPAGTKDANGTFIFKDSLKLFLHFSIQEGSKVGRILFSIKKKDNVLHKFIVSSNHAVNHIIKVEKGDSITIEANAAGSTAGDWGNLKVLKVEPNYIFKLRLLPFLWVIFFIYLIGKGHTYIAFNSYLGFLLTLMAEKVTFGTILFIDAFTYTALFFFFAFLFALIYQELQVMRKFKVATAISSVATVILYAVPLVFIVFTLVFGKPIDWNILYAVYQTNFDEALGFVETFIPLYYFLFILLFTFIVAYILWRQELKERKIIERSLLMFVIIFLGIFVSIRFFELRIPHLIKSTYKNYHRELDYLANFEKKRKASKIKFSASKKEKGEIYVVVIGESLNRYNMSLYGYFKNTTPRLLQQKKEHGLQVFNNAYSNAGSTMLALSYALTEANQYNNKKYFESLSLIDIFNKADFDTYWLTTQGITPDSETLVSLIANTAKHIRNLADNVIAITGVSGYYDENNIQALQQEMLKNNGKNKLFIIHIMGSHFKYDDRYPSKFSKYQTFAPYIVGTNDKRILGDYNKYDNSVYYNDYVVNKLLEILQKHGGVSGFLYFSDHSEDIAHHRGHTSRLESFTFPMFQIPMMAWFSNDYIQRYPETYKRFVVHKDKLFSNDMLYDTIIGLSHVKTNHYNPVYDLSSKEYHLTPKDALALHGNVRYTDPRNFYYWQKVNTKLLKDSNLSRKIVIADTDSVGKLEDAWRMGYRSFKLNLFYVDSKKSFQTGTIKYNTGGNLLDLLHFFDLKKIKHLFLNLNNVSESNIDAIIKRLNIIESRLHIKNKSVLITNQESLVAILKQKGWKVALDTKKYQEKNDSADYHVYSGNLNNENLPNHSIAKRIFNLSDSRSSKKEKTLEELKNNNVDFIFIDFTSEYQEWYNTPHS